MLYFFPCGTFSKITLISYRIKMSRYRDIFSNLSNETVGAALYLYIPLQRCYKMLQDIDAKNNCQNVYSSRRYFVVKYISFFSNLSAVYYSYYNYLISIFKQYPLVLLHSMVNIKSSKMKVILSTPELALAYYHPLLQRYAMRIINNAAVAELLVTQVLQDQYDIDKLAPRTQLRNVLKIDLLNRCDYWKQAIIFDRPLVKVPSFRSVKNDNKKNHPIN